MLNQSGETTNLLQAEAPFPNPSNCTKSQWSCQALQTFPGHSTEKHELLQKIKPVFSFLAFPVNKCTEAAQKYGVWFVFVSLCANQLFNSSKVYYFLRIIVVKLHKTESYCDFSICPLLFFRCFLHFVFIISCVIKYLPKSNGILSVVKVFRSVLPPLFICQVK